MKAPAVVFEAARRVCVREIEVPAPGAGEVRVATQVSVISAGTEGHCLQERFSWQATPFPCVPGYQRVGTVESVGPGVTQWHVGQRVMATTSRFEPDASGVSAQWGSHAALAVSPADELYALPAGIDDFDAAGAVVAQVGWNAASRAVSGKEEWVLVLGDGLIGQLAAQAARVRGARTILAGRRPDRLALARRFSADSVLDTRAQNLVDAGRSITGGAPVAAVLDSVQGEAAQLSYLDLLEHGRGQVVYCGNSFETTWANMALLQQRELSAHFVSGWTPARMNATLHSLARREMRLRPLLTHIVPFEEAPRMYELLLGQGEPFLGMALDWRGAVG